ncbi:hypothetical protein GSI_01894 [Ganoderma sinense ZZ0214-1]|uniref:Uncharacterized protein n=1 Tax=Ganoderma sinense ZZ0214-1 TaxID=1077348 RepID=A0A2G8SR61_9APHY|nr:hypothetical protein GSI_01894 [Ganoderma sinense ZZ0214-1]
MECNFPGETSVLYQDHCFPLFVGDNVREKIGRFSCGRWRDLGSRVKSQIQDQTRHWPLVPLVAREHVTRGRNRVLAVSLFDNRLVDSVHHPPHAHSLVMATRKVADHTLYHLSPKGFWKKFRDTVAVNPDISSGLPLPSVHRFPPPGSRPEKYCTPATKASDPAQNPYWKRDVRRAYPQLSVVTQSELSTLLLDHAQAQQVIVAPGEGQKAEASSVPAEHPQGGVDLTQAIATIASARKAYSESKLPPTPPIAFKQWRPERAEDAPHDPHAYFPMILVK